MRKLMKIEVSEAGDDLLATDDKGEVYPVSYSAMKEISAEAGTHLVELVQKHLQYWGSVGSDYLLHDRNDDWQTIYEADE